MCLVVAAWRAHPRYRLILAANRDEFYDRAATPAAPWPELPNLIAGRDLQAGGTWLGVDSQRRFGVITNFREMQRPKRRAPSRGGLVRDFLQGAESAGDYLARLEIEAPAYAGFSLLLGDSTGLWYASNRADSFATELAPGVYGLSNHLLDTPWPKLLRVRQGLQQWLHDDAAAPAAAEPLFSLLADRRGQAIPPGLHADQSATGLSAEWEAALSSPFIHHGGYGTRCSTLLLITDSGALDFRERRFDSTGTFSGETRYNLAAGNWPETAA